MKYLFLLMGILSGILFGLGSIHRIQTGEIIAGYYPNIILAWLGWGMFEILSRLDKRD